MVKLSVLKLIGRVAQGLLLFMIPAALAMAVAESVVRPRPSCILVAKFRPGVLVPGCEDVGNAISGLQNQQRELDAMLDAIDGRPRTEVVQAATVAIERAERRQLAQRESRTRESFTTESVVSSVWFVSEARSLALIALCLALAAAVLSLVPIEGLPRLLFVLGGLLVLASTLWLAADRWMRPALHCYVTPAVLKTLAPRGTCEVEADELDRRWRKLFRDLPIVEREVLRLEDAFSASVADQAAEAAVRRDRTVIQEPEDLRLLRDRAGAMRRSQQELVDEIWYRSIPYTGLALGAMAYGLTFILTGLGLAGWRVQREKVASKVAAKSTRA